MSIIMSKKKLKKTQAVLYDKDGNTIFNLASTEANDDWIRAARLKKQGRLDELEGIKKNAMYEIKDEDDKLENDNSD